MSGNIIIIIVYLFVFHTQYYFLNTHVNFTVSTRGLCSIGVEGMCNYKSVCMS